MMRKLVFLTLVFVAGAAGYGAVAHGYIVNNPNRNPHFGYFQNLQDDWGSSVLPTIYDGNVNAIPNYVDTAQELIDFMVTNLNAQWYTQQGVGAAFIIDGMEGGGTNGPSAATLAQWKADVYYYDSQGWINWNASYTYAINTYYQGTGSGSNYNDDAFYCVGVDTGGGSCSGTNTSAAIVFSHGGKVFAIRRQCGNPVMNGNLTPVDHNPGWDITGYTTKTVSSAAVGSTVHFYHHLKNNLGGTTAPTQIWWASIDTMNGNVQTIPGHPYGTMSPFDDLQVADEAYTVQASDLVNGKVCRATNWAPVNSSGGNLTSTPMCITVVSAATLSCGGVTVTPTGLDPADAYTVAAVIKVAEGQAAAQTVHDSSSFYVNVTGPGVNSLNPAVASTVATSGSYGTLTTALAQSATNNAGTYTVNYGITGLPSIACPPITFVVTYTPYFSVQGGDVAAGPGFGSACAMPSSADIKGRNLGTAASGYFGAGSQLGAFSLGTITGFATNTTLSPPGPNGSNSSGGTASQPSGLAFASGSGGATIGTTYGKDPVDDPIPGDNPSWCVPDYHGNASVSGAPTFSTTTLDQTSLTSGAFTSGKTYVYTPSTANTPLTLNGALMLGGAAPSRLTIVVHGDVIINGNITYSPYTYTAGVTNIGSIPQFQLIVKGNIYIGKGVTTLTGFYDAQRDTTDGYIYTCAQGQKYLTDNAGDVSTNALFAGTYYSDCSSSLTIYGSVAAYGYKLNRTGGSWKQTASVNNTPAEKIVYTPELWLGNLSTNSSTGVQPYDAITSLPPIL